MQKSELAIIIVNRNRPDLTDKLVEQLLPMGAGKRKDIYVVECGSDPDKRSKYASLYYSDSDFRGKCYGHNEGLKHVLNVHGRYSYYWFLMNDLVFEIDPDPIDTMIRIMQSEPALGILSPTERDSYYAASKPLLSRDWHRVSTCDYLALFMRDDCLQSVGFLNPQFKYSWGAIHELSYKMYSSGWSIAYCDKVIMKHLGGTTYGAAANTIARAEYIKRARAWAAEYFEQTYGKNWDELFSSHLPPDIEVNTYKIHRQLWEGRKKKGSQLLKKIKSLISSP